MNNSRASQDCTHPAIKRRNLPWGGLIAIFLLLAAGFQALGGEKGKEVTSANKKSRRIAITFDELPAARGFGDIDRTAITYLTLQALNKHKVQATGFVVGEYIGDAYDILGQWLNDGHILGNLTYSYQDYNQLDAENFISDISAGQDALETMLAGFGQKKRYFRYPFLHYGTTVESKREVENYLEARELTAVPATVIVEDYVYNLSLEKMGKVPDSTKFFDLMNDYLNHVLDEVERSERLSQEILNRPCRHILLLRANRLNAVFLDEMLTALEEMGFEFITLPNALKDKLYLEPEAYFGLKGISYLDMIRLSDPDLLPAK
ncbi:MAG: polysaccharide deacetylase family protein [candidate division Zixibacteria bacterium]|nr:polysaccharide deacetylase family protein [candidate division Zixibacteria bacterium]